MQLPVEEEPRPRDGRVPFRSRRVARGEWLQAERRRRRPGPAGHRFRPPQHAGRPAQRLLQEVGGREHRVGDPELERLGAAQHLVLRQRVLDDQLERAGRADQAGQQVGAAPAGDQAEEALGEGDHRHAGGDGPVGAVQRGLEAAAERDAVDERERGHRQLTEPPEDRVAEGGDAKGPVPRLGRVGGRGGDRRGGAVQVRAGREDERLAGHADRGDLAGRRPRRDRVEGGAQRQQPLRAEGVRLGVVVPVVQRDQGEQAGARAEVDVADDRPGDHLGGEVRGSGKGPAHTGDAHGGQLLFHSGFSHSTVPPMPMPTHMVVSP